METGNIIAILGVIATLVAGFGAWKFYINKNSKSVKSSKGKYQISNMDSSNIKITFGGESNESDKQD